MTGKERNTIIEAVNIVENIPSRNLEEISKEELQAINTVVDFVNDIIAKTPEVEYIPLSVGEPIELYESNLTFANSLIQPYTLEQLKKMDGAPIWIEILKFTVGCPAGYGINCLSGELRRDAVTQNFTTWTLWYSEYGTTWVAYPIARGLMKR